MKKLFLISAVTVLLISCNKEEFDCICTTEFAMITISVVDSLNNPVDSLNVNIEDEFGRTIKPIYKQLQFVPGRYVVIDDSYVNYLLTDPLLIRFTVSDSLGRTVQAFIVVNTDECRCHVNKISGADKIVLR
uniref:Uncharacterized protein n=1 Tax=Ignavibacterium album TaxID=591197 RepID=A0A832LL05_9BACT